jgi:Arylsulfotransferase (ASST)
MQAAKSLIAWSAYSCTKRTLKFPLAKLNTNYLRYRIFCRTIRDTIFVAIFIIDTATSSTATPVPPEGEIGLIITNDGEPTRHRSHAMLAILLCLSMLGISLLASCGSGGGGNGSSQTPPPPSGPGKDTLLISSSTGFFPAYDPTISDYAVFERPGLTVPISVQAGSAVQVAIDTRAARTGTFLTQVPVSAGQSFNFVVTDAGVTHTCHVRCLPTDFPKWTAEKPGTPQAEFTIVEPNIAINTGPLKNYIIIADANGVPVWWYKAAGEPRSGIVTAAGNIAYTMGNVVEVRELNGSLVRSFKQAGNGTALDLHELRELPNGSFVVIADATVSNVDLTVAGGKGIGKVTDCIIQEIDTSGNLAWSWSAYSHIPLQECDIVWQPIVIANQSPADPFHMNSVEASGDGYVVSFRHMNAVYKINRATGDVEWKLGGTARAESLTMLGDTFGNFGGQHDARVLADGSVTVHDNGTMRLRSPRAARYAIDTVNKTATMIEQITDADVNSSGCCGSARKLPSCDWVIDWGLTPYVTELTPAGARVSRLTFSDQYFSYRAEPVAFGVLQQSALVDAMNARYPR